jgi:hypothetical protein
MIKVECKKCHVSYSMDYEPVLSPSECAIAIDGYLSNKKCEVCGDSNWKILGES